MVYLVEHHTWLHHLRLNFLLLRHRLPLPASCFAMWFAPFVALMAPVWLLLDVLIALSQSAPERARIQRAELVADVRHGRAVIVPVGYGLEDGEGRACARAPARPRAPQRRASLAATCLVKTTFWSALALCRGASCAAPSSVMR